MSVLPLEPDRPAMELLGADFLGRAIDRLCNVSMVPAGIPDVYDMDLLRVLQESPPDDPGDQEQILGLLAKAAAQGLESAGPGNLAYIPGSGLFTAALAEMYARTVNKHGGLAGVAAGFAAMEAGILSWIARDVCGLPIGSSGLLTSGGSMATFSAVVAARHRILGEDHLDGTVYLTPHAHHSVSKAARMAGIKAANVREVPLDADLRMDIAAAQAMIDEDRRAGLRPFLLVATAGTTDTGTIDPLFELAELARTSGTWFHVDAAYGGFFALTERGRKRLRGMERADSITLDPHKSLFMPFGTGALVVRDPASLAEAHGGSGDYLQDLDTGTGLPNWSDLGPELTRETRGVRMWVPLRLHGVGAFRDALDEKLDLTERVHAEIATIAGLQVPLTPDLSTVVFRAAPIDSSPAAEALADEQTLRLLTSINAHQRVILSSTKIAGRVHLRVCTLSHRTHESTIREALRIIRLESRALHGLSTPAERVPQPQVVVTTLLRR